MSIGKFSLKSETPPGGEHYHITKKSIQVRNPDASIGFITLNYNPFHGWSTEAAGKLLFKVIFFISLFY